MCFPDIYVEFWNTSCLIKRLMASFLNDDYYKIVFGDTCFGEAIINPLSTTILIHKYVCILYSYIPLH